MDSVKQFCGSRSLIARGGTAEIFTWDEGANGRVLKLFHDWFPRSRVECEFNVSRALYSAGLPVPEPHELVDLDNRAGIVFDRIEGISMLRLVERQPWKLFYAARLLAELHAQIHTHNAPAELPRQRAQIEGWLAAAEDFTEEERLAAEKSLALLPDEETLCHGDFHPAHICSRIAGRSLSTGSARPGDTPTQTSREHLFCLRAPNYPRTPRVLFACCPMFAPTSPSYVPEPLFADTRWRTR